jgi:hypothetical protein
MHTVSQFAIRFLLVLCLVSAAVAQVTTPANQQRAPLTVTASASSDRVRFTSPSSVVQIRLEIYNSTGKKVFENEVRGGNVLDWHLEDGQAEPIADDTYLCAVTVKSLAGKLTQRIGSVTFEKGAASVKAIDVSQMTAQQAEAVGPVEENASFVVLNEGERQTPTVIAHNGEEGQLIRGRGALSFRIGDFFSGKDTEQMRLTTEGNLGIGITHPAVKLDVDGLIRSSQGIVFPDGTIQFSAASKTLGAKSSRSGQKPGSGQDFQTQAAGTGTQNRIAKWIDNSGTLGDSGITETNSGFIGIGTSSPDSLLNVQGTIPFTLGHMGMIRTTGSNNGFGLVMDAAGTGNNNLGLSVGGVPKGVFSWDNSRNFIGLANLAYSPNDFSLRVNSNGSLTYHDGASSAERFRITADGNVGIGTTSVGSLLTVGSTSTRGTLNVVGSTIAIPVMSLTDSRASGHQYSIYGGVTGTGNLDIYDQTAAATRLTINSSGNVGIGTTSPQDKLDVRGNVKLGNSGQLYAPGGEENLRIIRGIIDKNGFIIAGSGFQSSLRAPGSYSITFDTPFAGPPTVTVTVEFFEYFIFGMTDGVTSSSAVIATCKLNGNTYSSDFHFIAIGPR